MGSSLRLITCHFFLLGFITFTPAILMAQTYASPDMEYDAQQQISAKNKQLGIVEEPTVADENFSRNYHNIDPALLKGTYQLKNVAAIDHSGKHSKAQMKLFAANAKQEFDSRHIAIDLVQHKIYFISKHDKADQTIYSIDIADGWIVVNGYRECSDYKFKIDSVTPFDITLTMVPQNENQHFIFELTLAKN